MSRRGSITDGEVGKTSVGRGTTYTTEIVMTCRTKHIQLRLTPSGVRSSFDRIHQIIIDTHSNLISCVIIVAKERCMITDILTHLLLTLPVNGTSPQYLVHRITMILEHMLL